MDIINIRNTPITIKDVEEIFTRAGIRKKVNDISKYQRSFTQKSYKRETNYSILDNMIRLKPGLVDFQQQSNERYEFAGDSVLGQVICNYLFERFHGYDEGFMTKIKTNVVSKTALPKFARYHNFQKFILLTNNLENIHGRDNDKFLEDAFEAFICAINLDQGYETAKKFIIETLEANTNFGKILFNNNNYKDQLMIALQKDGKGHAKYEILCELGPSSKRTYIVIAYYMIDKKKFYLCKGKSRLNKQEAEQDSALNSLKKFYNF